METTQAIYFVLTSLGVMLPQLLIIIGGIIYSFMNMEKNPQTGKLALAGLGIMLLVGLLGLVVTFIQIQLPSWYGVYSYVTITYIATAIHFVFNIIWAVGLGLLVYAVWTGRNKS